ncbi:ricin-type beta-trefoil lectin domain protein (plasmid) [Streptomyces sp. HUAS TT11]|uniref:ricin-type beta-trefoil lectin domain protein n=1 Tax=Streptomyces sp. HUAS TT11 TaxID=3447508 RepID=UPI003F65B520
MTLRPADTRPSGTVRRAGSRGALAVVSIVGLLAAAGVLLTFGMTGQHDGQRHSGSSTAIGSHDYGGKVTDGIGPSSDPSADGTSSSVTTDGKRRAKPTIGSSSSSTPSNGSLTPDEPPAVSNSAPSRSTATRQASVPGATVFSHASHRCIDVVGGKAVQGARLMIWDCSSTAASQHWVFKADGSMRGLGMCVQLAGGSTADGTVLELAHCNGDAAQQFTLNTRHDLVSGLADKCADVRDEGTKNGTRLQLWSCAGTDNQKWSTA